MIIERFGESLSIVEQEKLEEELEKRMKEKEKLDQQKVEYMKKNPTIGTKTQKTDRLTQGLHHLNGHYDL